MGGIWFVSYFAGYENPNLPGIKSFTALPFRAYLMGDLLPGVALHLTPGYLISPLRGLRTQNVRKGGLGIITCP
jgi:hypothetical protein